MLCIEHSHLSYIVYDDNGSYSDDKCNIRGYIDYKITDTITHYHILFW